MILYTFSFSYSMGESWSPDFERECRRAPDLHETYRWTKDMRAGTKGNQRNFLQVGFEPIRPGPFIGPSAELSSFLTKLAERFHGTLHTVTITGTQRNPLLVEVPNFD